MTFKQFYITESTESREAMRKQHLSHVGYGFYKNQRGETFIWLPVERKMEKVKDDRQIERIA
jgi:hypothetical protein